MSVSSRLRRTSSEWRWQQRLRGVEELAVEGGEAGEHLRLRRLAAIGRQRARQPGIGEPPPTAPRR